MNLKTKILVIGTILVIGLWFWNKFSIYIFYSFPAKAKFNVKGKFNCKTIYPQIVNQSNKFYFAGRVTPLLWQWTPPGIEYEFSGILIEGINELLSYKQIVAYGYFKNTTTNVPTSKSPLGKTEKASFRVFHIERAIPLTFSYLKCPEKVMKNKKFEINLLFTNPFFKPLKAYFSLEGTPEFWNLPKNEEYNFNPGESKNFKWKLSAAKSGYGDIAVHICGVSDIGVVWTKEKCRVEVLSPAIIDIRDKYVEVPEERIGKPLKIEFEVRNIGDLNAKDVSVKISLPKNVTATNTTWHLNSLAGGEKVTLSTDLTFSKTKDFVIDVYAHDSSGNNASGIIYIHLLPNLSASFTTFSDSGIDTNKDGLYNFLEINAGVNVKVGGIAILKGELYDIEGNKIATAENSTYVKPGKHSIILRFDGYDIFKHRKNGPYNVYLELKDRENNLLDNKSFKTLAYNFNDFKGLAALTGYYYDYGRDINGNGKFDYLTIEVGVYVRKIREPVQCFLKARLVDNKGKEIGWASNTSYLSSGNQIVKLNFNGTVIYRHGVDGPYYVSIYLSHISGSEYIPKAYITKSYSYAEFGK